MFEFDPKDLDFILQEALRYCKEKSVTYFHTLDIYSYMNKSFDFDKLNTVFEWMHINHPQLITRVKIYSPPNKTIWVNKSSIKTFLNDGGFIKAQKKIDKDKSLNRKAQILTISSGWAAIISALAAVITIILSFSTCNSQKKQDQLEIRVKALEDSLHLNH
jgi:hypothetical protein